MGAVAKVGELGRSEVPPLRGAVRLAVLAALLARKTPAGRELCSAASRAIESNNPGLTNTAEFCRIWSTHRHISVKISDWPMNQKDGQAQMTNNDNIVNLIF